MDRSNVYPVSQVSQYQKFVGLITSDGKRPWLDACMHDKAVLIEADNKCPMLNAGLEENGPRRRPLGMGRPKGKPDEDANGYAAIARRVLEDGLE
jgi:hypothetical protein